MSFDKVLKFGGSVLKDVNDVINITNIVRSTKSQTNQIVLVFSAFYGITDKLIELGNSVAQQQDYHKSFEDIKTYHHNIMNGLNFTKEEIENVDKLFKKIENTLLVIQDRKKLFDDAKDYLITFGERLSNYIIYLHLLKTEDVVRMSPCDIIKTDSNFGNAKVNIKKTTECITKCFKEIQNSIVICAGFIGLDDNERITSLGRNGSDYTASLIASVLKVKQLEIWKDIDGLYTADPKIVKDVKFIKKLSYTEMAELSSLGNKVLHINAIAPCIMAHIPIIIRNCYNLNSEGTIISKDKFENYNINGIVKCDNVVILKYILGEYINITDFVIKLQKILQNFENDVITISQNLKQKIVSIIIKNNSLKELNEKVKSVFCENIKNNDIEIVCGKLNSMITIIGADLSGVVGISGTIFNTLKKNNINVDAIHDDFSATRISFLCDVNDANRVVVLLHKELLEQTANI